MIKYFMVFVISVLFYSSCYAQSYVRKTLEPDFFIPTSDKFHQQEKLPPVFLKKKQNIVEEIAEVEKKIETEVEEATEAIIYPEYKNKYNVYHQNLQKIAKGEVISHSEMVASLTMMQNGHVFEVTKTPSQETEVKQRFEKVLEESLKQN